MPKTETAEMIRSFNRFYTETIGALDEQHEGLSLNLAQARMLYTVAQHPHGQVSDIATALQLDLAYTSRVLGTLEDAKLLRRTISPVDRRQRVITLTAAGRRTVEQIVARSNARVLALIAHLDDDDVSGLLAAMSTIQRLITKGPSE